MVSLRKINEATSNRLLSDIREAEKSDFLNFFNEFVGTLLIDGSSYDQYAYIDAKKLGPSWRITPNRRDPLLPFDTISKESAIFAVNLVAQPPFELELASSKGPSADQLGTPPQYYEVSWLKTGTVPHSYVLELSLRQGWADQDVETHEAFVRWLVNAGVITDLRGPKSNGPTIVVAIRVPPGEMAPNSPTLPSKPRKAPPKEVPKDSDKKS